MKRFRLSFRAVIAFLSLAAAGLALSNCGGVLDATIGGTLAGLSGGTSVVLLDNGSDPITVSANGTFTFDQTVSAQDSYNVTVETQPLGETCTVTNGTGTVTQNGGDITDITVTCNATTTSSNYVLFTVSGLTSGQSFVLEENGSATQTVSGNGEFVFESALSIGATYSIVVETQPSSQTCTIANGSGTISSSGNTTMTVTCQ